MTIAPLLTGLGQAHHGAIFREAAALAEADRRAKAGRLDYCKQGEIKPLPDDSALALDNELDQFSGLSNRAKTSFQFFDRLFGVQFGPIQDPV